MDISGERGSEMDWHGQLSKMSVDYLKNKWQADTCRK
jgi:hypothetical protein